MMSIKPDTDFAIVRGPRNIQPMIISIQKKDEFDFTDYRYLKMNRLYRRESPVEEWVFKDDLELYQKAIV